jgi:hypothetical protein
MDPSILRRAAAALLAGTAGLHLLLAPEYFGEKGYVGVLFLLGAAAGGLVAARLWMADDARAWLAGTLVAAGMAAGFVLSRTVGLPGFHEAEWEGSGLLSLALEAGFVALATARSRAGRALAEARS